MKDDDDIHLRSDQLECKSLQEQIAKLEIKINKNKKYGENLETAKSEHTNLREKIKESNTEKTKLSSQFRKVDGVLKNGLRNDSAHISRLKRTGDKLVAKIQEEVSTEREKALNAIDALKHEIKVRLRTVDIEIEDLINTNQQSKLRNKSLKKELLKEKEKSSTLQNQLDKNENQIKLLESQLERARENNNKVATERHDYLSQLQSKSRQSSELRVRIDVLSRKRDESKIIPRQSIKTNDVEEDI